jgi:hypothetical protein
MHVVFAHALMLVFSSATGRYGWFMAHNPEQALRLFTFGTEAAFGKRFFLGWNKGVGWFFTVFGCFGIAVFLALLSVDLFRLL